MFFSVFFLKHLSPQFMSCVCIPVVILSSLLNSLLKNLFSSVSFLVFLFPTTKSACSNSFMNSGMYSGLSCKSASIVIIVFPLACLNPTFSALLLPLFGIMFMSFTGKLAIVPSVLSLLPSFMIIISYVPFTCLIVVCISFTSVGMFSPSLYAGITIEYVTCFPFFFCFLCISHNSSFVGSLWYPFCNGCCIEIWLGPAITLHISPVFLSYSAIPTFVILFSSFYIKPLSRGEVF